MEQRRADALVLLATSTEQHRVSTEVVLHVTADALAGERGGQSAAPEARGRFQSQVFDGKGAVLDCGAVLHPETARRLSCDARLQVALHGDGGKPLGIGRASQIAPTWLRRQVFHRDGNTCTFPGCGMRRFLSPHHVVHWTREGPTDLDNLVTVCSTHHALVHEHGWSVTLDDERRPTWFRPSGRVHDPGPAPPRDAAPPERDRPSPAEAAGYSRIFDVASLLARVAAGSPSVTARSAA